ncbi:HTH-type transcriptional regulatory protein GabR [compost metagenome]
MLEQRALAALIESGAYERHVRRMRRENERRRAALLDGIARYLPADAEVSGTAAGLHVVLWLPSLRPRDEAALVAAAREQEVGVYPLSPLFAMPRSQGRTRPLGLVLGYASLTTAQILQGMRSLGTVIAAMRQ